MTLARTPYARLSPADIGQVDRELKKLEQMSNGLFVPKVLVAARSPYTVQGTDTMLLCDCTAGAVTLTFPLAARVDGMSVQVVKSDTSANAVTLSGTFSGVASPTLTVPDSGFTVAAMNGSYHVTAFVSYPIVTGETGVTAIVYDYGDPRRYGATGVAGTDARAAFAATDVAAIAGYGANGEVSPHGGTHRLASNLTITSPYRPRPKAIAKPDSGVTLTLNGAMTAGAYQTFDLSAGGKVLAGKGATCDIYPEWFGADPTGTNDSTVALQAMLDTAIASNIVLGAVVRCVALGRYKTTDSLHGFSYSGGVFSFCTFHLEGRKGYITNKQVEIVPTFTDRPVLILQAARCVEINRMTFTGALANVAPTFLQTLQDLGGSAGTPWWNSGSTGRDQRYSPYCAIAIDPFSNGLPPDGGIPGHSAFYTQNVGSSVVTIQGCTLRQFIVAFGIGLSNGSLQCDSVMVRDCVVENVKVVMALGHNQTRNVSSENLHVLYARTVYDCRNYGVGAGNLPNISDGAVAGGCKWLMIGAGAFEGGSVKQLYAEAIWSLGQWVGPFPITFDDCNIHLLPAGQGGNPSSHLDSGGPVIFRGGFCGYFNNVPGRMSINGTVRFMFDGCELSGEPVLLRMATADFHRAPLRWSNAGNQYGIAHEFRELFQSFASNAEPVLGSNGCVHESISSTLYRRLRWRDYEHVLTADAAAVITVAGGAGSATTATFTSAAAALVLQVGEVLCASSNAAFKIEKFAATDADVQPNGLAIGTVQSIVGSVVTLQDVPNGVTSGTYSTFLKRLPRFRSRTIGTTTSGSNVISSCFPAPAMWQVGDRIAGTNIPVGSYVTARSTGSATITISQNATGTSTAEVYDVKMFAEEATAAAAPTSDVWYQGDFVKNVAGTKDVNNMIPTGWRCTVSGRGDGTAPAATFETIYGSTVTPAT